MKVRCNKIINKRTMQPILTSPSLTVGKEYVILSIEVCQENVFYLLVDDDINQHPHLHDAKQFEITSHFIPSIKPLPLTEVILSL